MLFFDEEFVEEEAVEDLDFERKRGRLNLRVLLANHLDDLVAMLVVAIGG